MFWHSGMKTTPVFWFLRRPEIPTCTVAGGDVIFYMQFDITLKAVRNDCRDVINTVIIGNAEKVPFFHHNHHTGPIYSDFSLKSIDHHDLVH